MPRWGPVVAGIVLLAGGAWWLLWGPAEGSDLPAARNPVQVAVVQAPGAPAPLALAEGAVPPPPEPPRRPGQRFVRVVDGATGAALPEAKLVVLWSEDDEIYWDERGRCGEQLDAHGRYPIGEDWQGARLLAVVPNLRSSAWVPWAPGGGDIECRLEAGGVITGTVRERGSRAPVPHAEVVLGVRGLADVVEGPRTHTDEAGCYAFSGLPPGVEFIPFLKDSVRFRGPLVDLVSGPGRMVEVPGEPAPELVAARFETPSGTRSIDIEAELEPGVLVRFRLRLPHGRDPAALRCVHAVTYEAEAGLSSGGWSWAFCDRDGAEFRATVFLPEGRNELSFVGQGIYTALPPRDVRGRLPVEPHEVILDAVRPLVAQLVDEFGRPVARAGVAIERCRQNRPFSFGQPAGFKKWDTTGGSGTLELGEELEDLQPAEGRMPETLHLRAVADGLFSGADRIGPWAASFDLRVLWREVLEPGDRPVVLPVPARPWIPLRVRVIAQDRSPVAGVVLRGAPADAFDGDAAVTDGSGYATLTLRRLPARAVGLVQDPIPESAPDPVLTIESELWAGSRAASLVLAGIAMWWDQLHDFDPDGDGPVFRHVGVPALSPRELERGTVALAATPVCARTIRLIDVDGRPIPPQGIEIWCGDGFNGWRQPCRVGAGGSVRVRVPSDVGVTWLHAKLEHDRHRAWLRVVRDAEGEEVIATDRSQAFVVMHEDGRALEQESRARLVVQGIDADGDPVPWVSKRWDAHRLATTAPGATRRMRLEYLGATQEFVLPARGPIDPPPEWRVP